MLAECHSKLLNSLLAAAVLAGACFAAEPLAVTVDLKSVAVQNFMGIGVQWDPYEYQPSAEAWKTTLRRVDFMRPGLFRVMLNASSYVRGFDAAGNPQYVWSEGQTGMERLASLDVPLLRPRTARGRRRLPSPRREGSLRRPGERRKHRTALARRGIPDKRPRALARVFQTPTAVVAQALVPAASRLFGTLGLFILRCAPRRMSTHLDTLAVVIPPRSQFSVGFSSR
jgi:hypothetical protein